MKDGDRILLVIEDDPKFAKILAEQVKMKEWTEASLTELLNDGYMNRLY